MQTLIVIHGADSFDTDESYLNFLKNTYIPRNIEPWKEGSNREWKKEIAKQWIQNGGVVYMPMMPNKQRAIYHEWKSLFEQLVQQLSEKNNITLIGNSLGGCFLLKYFSEVQDFGYSIEAIHLIAACIECGDFLPPNNYKYLQNLGDRVHIWHAEDDDVVPFAVGQELSHHLGDAQTHFFPSEKGYGHFFGLERIEELEEVIFACR